MSDGSNVKKGTGGGAARGEGDGRGLFAAEVEELLTARGIRVVRRIAEDYALVVAVGGAEHTMGLHNLFHETRELDFQARRALMTRFVGVLLAPPEPMDVWEDVAERLVPVLRATTMFGSLRNMQGAPLLRSFAPHLVEAVAIDTPQTTQIVVGETAARWGRPIEELLARAYQNLAAVPTAFQPHDPTAPYLLLRVANDDNYQSSRLLLPGWLAQLGTVVKGKPVAGVPDRETLLIGSADDPACVARLLDATKRQYASSPRSISPALYTVDDDGRVVPWRPPVDHPSRLDVEQAHLELELREYESTKEKLQAEVGEALFVASYKGVRTDSEVWSYCTWTRGVPSLLPRTDRVVLVDLDQEGSKPKHLSWAEVEGALTKVEGRAPPRHRTADWPLA